MRQVGWPCKISPATDGYLPLSRTREWVSYTAHREQNKRRICRGSRHRGSTTSRPTAERLCSWKCRMGRLGIRRSTYERRMAHQPFGLAMAIGLHYHPMGGGLHASLAMD